MYATRLKEDRFCSAWPSQQLPHRYPRFSPRRLTAPMRGSPRMSRARCRPTKSLSPPTAESRTFKILRYQSRSEEHTSELQSLMRISYAVFCLKKKKNNNKQNTKITKQT